MPRKPTGNGPEKKPSSSEKYRKPNTPVRIRPRLAEVAKDAAESLAQDLTQYVNDAVRMRLQAEGKWPPPEPPAPAPT